ncbi:MAG: hypothetical protein AAGB04_05925 [Pseudomonadota bacterium]
MATDNLGHHVCLWVKTDADVYPQVKGEGLFKKERNIVHSALQLEFRFQHGTDPKTRLLADQLDEMTQS